MAKQAGGGSTALSALGAPAQGSQAGQDVVSLLKADHREVEGLFGRYEKASTQPQKQQLAKEVCRQLNVHTRLEEELFYPACREKGVQDDALDEAQVEHDGAKVMISELLEGSPSDAFYDAKFKVLSEYIKHHVKEEEKPDDGIFAKAKEAGVDLNGLGQRLKARKSELLAQQGVAEQLPQLRALTAIRIEQPEQERQMNRPYYERDRDERGRFESDDRRRYRGGGSEEQDEGRGNEDRGSGRGWYGDPEGHARAAEQRWEHEGSRGEYRGRREEEDEGRYSGGSRGGGRGWHGDSEGHARASEEGWERREGQYGRGEGEYRGRRNEQEDDYRGSSFGGDRGRGGYESESSYERGRSEGGYRSRQEEDERDSGRGTGRGWYGDAEGHSRASERGWEHREQGGGGGSSRSSRGYSSSSREHEDNGRQSSGSGRGWYGDPQGHSRASEEGWRHRGGGGSRSSRH